MKYFYVVLCRTGTFLSKIISKVTGDWFTHASISFDDKLGDIDTILTEIVGSTLEVDNKEY